MPVRKTAGTELGKERVIGRYSVGTSKYNTDRHSELCDGRVVWIPSRTHVQTTVVTDASRIERERVGLCADCQHARRVASERGSVFWLCQYSAIDARFPKYPPLPVIRCAAYASRTGVRLS